MRLSKGSLREHNGSMNRQPATRAWGAALILMSIAPLVACAAECEDRPLISFYRGQAQVVTVLDETVEEVGGEWTIEPFERAGWCSFEQETDGKKFVATRSAALSGNLDVVAERVRAVWESRGLDVGTYVDPETDFHYVNATGTQGLYVYFGSNAYVMTLIGESACTRADGSTPGSTDERQHQP